MGLTKEEQALYDEIMGTTPNVVSSEYKVLTLKELRSQAKPIEWEWEGWLAKGVVTILAAESGEGKSMLGLHIASAFTNRAAFPNGHSRGQGGKVLWVDTEGFQNGTVERADNLAIDEANFLMWQLGDTFTDTDLDNTNHRRFLQEIVKSHKVDLVVVDSLSGGTIRDTKNSSQMMELMKFLVELARDNNIAVLITHHLRKRQMTDSKEISLDRLRDSSVASQMARLIWAMEPAGDDGVKKLHCIKNNLAEKPAPLGLTLDSFGITFTDAPKEEKMETLTDKAINFLEVTLHKGAVKAAVVLEQGQQAGLSAHSLRRAREKLHIDPVKTSEGYWVWQLPEKFV